MTTDPALERRVVLALAAGWDADGVEGEMDRVRERAARLSAEDRAAMDAGHYCTNIGAIPKPRKPRTPRPAPPHLYRSCLITTAEGSFVRCSRAGCQDERHATMAALGMLR